MLRCTGSATRKLAQNATVYYDSAGTYRPSSQALHSTHLRTFFVSKQDLSGSLSLTRFPVRRLRYYLSPQTRQAFAYVSKELDKITNHPSCPAAVKEGIAIARRLITRYSESILSVQTPAGAAAPARPAQGQARQGAAANGGR